MKMNDYPETFGKEPSTFKKAFKKYWLSFIAGCVCSAGAIVNTVCLILNPAQWQIEASGIFLNVLFAPANFTLFYIYYKNLKDQVD